MERRLKIMWVTPELLQSCSRDGRRHDVDGQRVRYLCNTTCDDPHFHEAKRVGIYYNFDRDAFGLMLYHPAWDIVPEFHAIPIYEPTFRHEMFKIREPLPEDETTLKVAEFVLGPQEMWPEESHVQPAGQEAENPPKRGYEFL